MAKIRRSVRGPTVSTRLPIPNILSVGRQPANKRQSFEAEVLDNAIVSLERNFEKRSGFDVVPPSNIAGLTVVDFTTNNPKIDLYNLSKYQIDPTSDLWFYWYNINEDQRYLVVINFSATGVTDKLFYIFQVNANNTWTEITSQTQWDTTTAAGNATITAYAAANGGISYAEAVALGSVSLVSRNYITYKGISGTKKAKESLKAITLGSTVVILNKNVYAGFSSDTDGYKFGLDGVVTGNQDIAGRKVIYWSAAKVKKVFSEGFDAIAGNTDDVFLGYRQNTANDAVFIPVQDFLYYDRNLPHVGQRVNDASVITLPPQDDDWYNNNTNTVTGDTKAQQMLRALYDNDHPHKDKVDGRGKIYFCLYPFLSLTSGYYRIGSFPEDSTHTITAGVGATTSVTGKGRPYLQKVRTPDEWSYIDPARMPQQLSFTITNSVTTWSTKTIEWTPRQTGDKFNNPGPSIFRTIDGKALRQVKITAISVFKDRLFMAADDLVFGSRIGVYEDFFLADATQITEADPIDIRASSNTFAQISSMTPFEDYLFIDTKANIQFTLSSGSANNTISPLSVAINPVTYYSTAPIVEPQMIGSQLFFWDTGRLYLYMGEDKTGLAKAVDLSLPVKDYLPQQFRCSTTAPSQDTIITVDDLNPNNIYLYTIRFSGDRVIQSSFYRFVLPTTSSVVATQAYGDYLYIVVKESNGRFLLQRCYLKADSTSKPKMDAAYLVKNINSDVGSYSCRYDSISNQTIWRVPASLPFATGKTVLSLVAPYLSPTTGEDISGVLYKPTVTRVVSEDSENSYYTLVVPGNIAVNGGYVQIGNLFTMEVQLSPLFFRDQDNGIVDGVLNLRTGVSRFNDTGDFRVEVSSRGRPALTSTFSAKMPDLAANQINTNIKKSGELVFKVFGYADLTSIKFISDYTTPCNITAIELKCKFKQKYSIIDNS